MIRPTEVTPSCHSQGAYGHRQHNEYDRDMLPFSAIQTSRFGRQREPLKGLLNLPKWTEYVAMTFSVVFVCVFTNFLINRQRAQAVLEPITAQASIPPSGPEAR